jgi:hypothetical protein
VSLLAVWSRRGSIPGAVWLIVASFLESSVPNNWIPSTMRPEEIQFLKPCPWYGFVQPSYSAPQVLVLLQS